MSLRFWYMFLITLFPRAQFPAYTQVGPGKCPEEAFSTVRAADKQELKRNWNQNQAGFSHQIIKRRESHATPATGYNCCGALQQPHSVPHKQETLGGLWKPPRQAGMQTHRNTGAAIRMVSLQPHLGSGWSCRGYRPKSDIEQNPFAFFIIEHLPCIKHSTGTDLQREVVKQMSFEGHILNIYCIISHQRLMLVSLSIPILQMRKWAQSG